MYIKDTFKNKQRIVMISTAMHFLKILYPVMSHVHRWNVTLTGTSFVLNCKDLEEDIS